MSKAAWTIAEAKAKFSEVVRKAEREGLEGDLVAAFDRRIFAMDSLAATERTRRLRARV